MRSDFRPLLRILARVLHFIAAEIEDLLPGSKISGSVTFTTEEGGTSMGEITVNEGDPPISATVSYVNQATGDPAEASDTPVWESADDFHKFVQSHLMPAAMKVGIQGQPQMEVFPVHAIYAAAFTA